MQLELEFELLTDQVGDRFSCVWFAPPWHEMRFQKQQSSLNYFSNKVKNLYIYTIKQSLVTLKCKFHKIELNNLQMLPASVFGSGGDVQSMLPDQPRSAWSLCLEEPVLRNHSEDSLVLIHPVESFSFFCGSILFYFALL